MSKPILFLDDSGVLNDSAVRAQVEELQHQLLKTFSENLVDIYLHGWIERQIGELTKEGTNPK